jgi:formylglycine-generating enzyme required for sulfatase activity
MKMKDIKKTLVIIWGLIMVFKIAQAQNDTMYVMKAGKVILKQSIKAADVDSIIFYNPIKSPSITLITANIPAGTFTMGSPTNEVDRKSNETQFQVTLSAFRMSKYEITNAQFATFLNEKSISSNGLYAAGAYPTKVLIYSTAPNPTDYGLHYNGTKWVPVTGYENCPIIGVTWYGAAEFATYVGGRLPTEAEWEYACRANTTSPFNTGNCLPNAKANYEWALPYNTCTNTNNNRPNKTLAVGTYTANAYGLYDMHGNAIEWCSDWYGTYPTTPQINPTGAASGTYRVLRGGKWLSDASGCRSAYRGYDNPDSTTPVTSGFRVVFNP